MIEEGFLLVGQDMNTTCVDAGPQAIRAIDSMRSQVFSHEALNLMEARADMAGILHGHRLFETLSRAVCKICRFAGNVDGFYSVGAHSLLMAAILGPQHCRYALVHDLTEAFTGDIVKFFKTSENEQREARLYANIITALNMYDPVQPGLQVRVPQCVKQIDGLLGDTEFMTLFRGAGNFGGFLQGTSSWGPESLVEEDAVSAIKGLSKVPWEQIHADMMDAWKVGYVAGGPQLIAKGRSKYLSPQKD